MDPILTAAEKAELAELERERQRIDAQLRAPGSATIEAMLRDERRWVERRKHGLERVRVASSATLRCGDASWACVVVDVSAHGAGLLSDEQPRLGEAVRLVLTDLDGAPSLQAVVRHVTGCRVGLEFLPHEGGARAVAEQLARHYAVRER